jgi:hypothetical protein
MCSLIVLGSVYVIIKDVNLLLSDNVISYGELAFFTVTLGFSLAILTGIYKNKKWALYIFISMVFFMGGNFIILRLSLNGALELVDFWIITCTLGVSAIVIRVMLKLDSMAIFSKNELD